MRKTRNKLRIRLTEDQRRVCARCGALKWFHEPGRVMVPDHEFTEKYKPVFAADQHGSKGGAR